MSSRSAAQVKKSEDLEVKGSDSEVVLQDFQPRRDIGCVFLQWIRKKPEPALNQFRNEVCDKLIESAGFSVEHSSYIAIQPLLGVAPICELV
jgi:hypothetical protein